LYPIGLHRADVSRSLFQCDFSRRTGIRFVAKAIEVIALPRILPTNRWPIDLNAL